MEIKKIAVLGSGVMGAGIAALCANAGADVLLLDIVPKDAENRNALAESAIAKQLAMGGFTHPANAARVTPGNLEDHLAQLGQADWIIEAVLERIDVKHDVYRKVDAVRKAGSVVSSNTSTLPLHALTAGLPDSFCADFMIAHFFNPPRHMRLLEVVQGPKTRADAYACVQAFADVRLGKEVVACKDTPGFLANRIGIFWMVAGLVEALRLGISVEEADAVMGRPAGFPGTGIFGLYDLIGIDLIPLIAKAMLDTLPRDDAFRTLYQQPELLKKMIADGYTGRKGKGGFYRVTKQGDKKIKEVLEFTTGQYRPEGGVQLQSAKAKTPAELVAAKDLGGQYAWAVLSKTLAYAASLIPEISEEIVSVDSALKFGYSWSFGPFELMDAIGPEYIAHRLREEGVPVPSMLAQAEGRKFYAEHDATPVFLQRSGEYAPIPRIPGHLWLADIKRGKSPVVSNASASLWDMGEGIACLEFTSKMNAVDHNILALIEQIIPRVRQDFKGLVIGNDSTRFSVGANLSVFLAHAKAGEWQAVSDLVRRGQQAVMALKYAPFPVVASLAGLALGGGCEIILHADAVQAHMESSPGLVEANVGLVPAWGGCKEMLTRRDALAAFDAIVTAQTAGSADEAREMHILNTASRIGMNRARLLADAKALCLELAKNYVAPAPKSIVTGGAKARQAMLTRLEALGASGKAGPHTLVIGRALSLVLSGGETDGPCSEQAILDLEHDAFLALIRTDASQARIEHMLNTGKPLRN